MFGFQEVSQLASSLYTTGTNLSRSVSSAGEHHSDTYVSPILPKRAETFGGFDNCTQGPLKLLGKKLSTSSTPAGTPDLENLKPGDSRLFVSNLTSNYHCGGCRNQWDECSVVSITLSRRLNF